MNPNCLEYWSLVNDRIQAWKNCGWLSTHCDFAYHIEGIILKKPVELNTFILLRALGQDVAEQVDAVIDIVLIPNET